MKMLILSVLIALITGMTTACNSGSVNSGAAGGSGAGQDQNNKIAKEQETGNKSAEKPKAEVSPKIKVDAASQESASNSKPPFIGKRWFNTTPRASGTGTPQLFLRITSDEEVFCGYTQTNQASGETSKEEVSLGKYKPKLNCVFKEFYDEELFFEIEGNKIYQLDKNNQVMKSEDCCARGDDSGDSCECKSDFYKE